MKNFSIEIKWAIIFFLVGLAWVIFEKAVGLHDVYISEHPLYTNFFGIIAVAIFILALREKKKKFYNGKMTWREGFTSGVIISVIVAILSPLSQYLVYEFITPQYFRNVIDYTVGTGRMTVEQAEAYFSLKSYIIQATFGALIMGVVTAAIVAWFVKTKKAE